nr:MAG TPA: hypothetical protein [Caudoviricetes sp.]
MSRGYQSMTICAQTICVTQSTRSVRSGGCGTAGLVALFSYPERNTGTEGTR